MATMSVWTFASAPGAEEALHSLERLQTLGAIVIEDASVVVWASAQRRPQTYQAGTVDGGGALCGAFWGLVFSVLFLLPHLGGTAEGDGGVVAGLARVGLPDEFLGRVRARVAPGTSALFLLTAAAELGPLRAALDGRYADVLLSVLAQQEERVLRLAFAADQDGIGDPWTPR